MNEMANDTCPGDLDVCDHSGNENHGTNNGATWTAGTAPTRTAVGPGHAFTFNGSSDYVSIPHTSELSPTSEITVAAWVKLTNIREGEYEPFVIKGTTGSFGSDQYGLWGWRGGLSGSGVGWRMSIGGSIRSVNSNEDLKNFENQWIHLVGTYDGSAMRIYRDGNQKNTTWTSGNIDVVDEPLYLGQEHDGRNNFAGNLDDVRIYNRALSADEVKYLHETTTPNYE